MTALTHLTHSVVERLRLGAALTDVEFDALYEDPHIRSHSNIHWTPLAAARRAIEWLGLTQASRVLDVGAGCGKFCLIGGLISPAYFVGVEQRAGLVRSASTLASNLGLHRVEFIHSDMRALDWSTFDAFYLYNPFAEYLFDAPDDPVIDRTIGQSAALYGDSIRFVEKQLSHLPSGTRLVTYNGFGGSVPRHFHLKKWERFGECYLRIWEKKSTPREQPALSDGLGGAINDDSAELE